MAEVMNMAVQDVAAAKELDALMAKHEITPYSLIGETPPNMVAIMQGEEVEPATDEEVIEYYMKVVDGVEQTMGPWLRKMYDKSADADPKHHPFEVSDNFVNAWLLHAFAGGLSVLKLERDGEIKAMALISMEYGLYSHVERLALVDIAGDTKEDVADLYQVFVKIAKLQKKMFGLDKYGTSEPGWDTKEVRTRVIKEV